VDSSLPRWQLLPKLGQEREGEQQLSLRGVAASPGIALGRAYIVGTETAASSGQQPRTAEQEWERYRWALEQLLQELDAAQQVAQREAPAMASVIESYRLMLSESALQETVQRSIAQGSTAEEALRAALEPTIYRLRFSSDAVLRERAVELEQFLRQLVALLRNRMPQRSCARNAVVVAHALTPSDVVLFHQAGAVGLVTVVGGITSHTAIMARTLGMPAVIGLRGALSLIRAQELLVVDGYAGVVIVRPNAETLARLQRHQSRAQWRIQLAQRLARIPAQTTDGYRVRLLATVASLQDVEDALVAGAEGIGLVRTELLVLQRRGVPGEEEQYAWYRQLCQGMGEAPVTIRLFDLGAEWREAIPVLERNPALGMRGIRYMLHHPELLRAQLRAILRVAAEGFTLRLLLPLVNSAEEVRTVRQMLRELALELGYRGRLPALGSMVETPAAALGAVKLAEVSDFLSIGTNDLTQYTLAVDREHELLAEMFDPLHPAVLELMYRTAQAARAKGVPVGVCGELASHAAATELLVGMGIEELSATPGALVPLKQRIRQLSRAVAQARLERLLSGRCSNGV
jgi:phosphotransferase system enzyme I (PtsI)